MPVQRSFNSIGKGIGHTSLCLFFMLAILAAFATAQPPARHIPLSLTAEDVIPTGNEWIALPAIRASDGALGSFNALSMRDKGLLEVTGESGTPALTPYFKIGDKRVQLHNPAWELIEYWIPVGKQTIDGVETTITYCAPPGSRAALVRLTMTNRRPDAVTVTLGMTASWGALSRITYTPIPLKGERTVIPAPWAKETHVFPFITHDTLFAWSFSHEGSGAKLLASPMNIAPGVDAQKKATLASGETVESHYVIGIGMEEYSASQSGEALEEMIDRSGVDVIVATAADWCRKRTRTTGEADLDVIMNRNFLFTAMFAWGRALDTEQLVGVTARSARYYVSAAYWDRDAMLWSFPGLLDIDPVMARDALDYALTTQLRNAGVHSRFIDGVVLEDGYELDEGVAPIIAMSQYMRQTGDDAFLASHAAALARLRACVMEHFDAATGLFTTLQDAQDQYRKQQFSTYDNVLVWKAFTEMALLAERLKDHATALDMTRRADALRAAIMKYTVSADAPGATGTVFVSATDTKDPIFADVPPGSLMKLPDLGFISQNDPLFVRTYEWLHSSNYKYSYSDQAYGLPGSYRLLFTPVWEVADHLGLERGRAQALKILKGSTWDGGIVTEGVGATTGVADYDGRAFATAAGYMAHSICKNFCKP